jgi:hypothetical protein
MARSRDNLGAEKFGRVSAHGMFAALKAHGGAVGRLTTLVRKMGADYSPTRDATIELLILHLFCLTFAFYGKPYRNGAGLGAFEGFYDHIGVSSADDKARWEDFLNGRFAEYHRAIQQGRGQEMEGIAALVGPRVAQDVSLRLLLALQLHIGAVMVAQAEAIADLEGKFEIMSAASERPPQPSSSPVRFALHDPQPFQTTRRNSRARRATKLGEAGKKGSKIVQGGGRKKSRRARKS